MPAERAFLDTNVLLAATDESRSTNAAALELLNTWPAQGTTLYLSGQILREYLVVTTRPTTANGLGLDMVGALANLDAFLERTTLLEEGAEVSFRLRQLLAAIYCAGKQVHDANVVATMVTHGVAALVTENTSDYVRFGDEINLVSLGHTGQ